MTDQTEKLRQGFEAAMRALLIPMWARKPDEYPLDDALIRGIDQ